MKVIRTVQGDIAPGDLGITATHEHLWCNQDLCCASDEFPSGIKSPMILQDQDMIVRELADFHAAGGRAVAEMTVHGWGRDVGVLRQISARAGVHVVATSGFYVEECHPAFADEWEIDQLADFLVGELTMGADGTDIRTGLLKSGVGRPVIEGRDKKCAQAVARAQTRTGVSITTHTSGSSRFEVLGGNLGEQHLDIFESEGVDPTRVIIGHTDENADIRQMVALAKRGAYVQFDVIGKWHWLLDETRVDLLRRLVDFGFADHLLLSSDRCRVHELKTGGGLGYDHVLCSFLPKLRQAGFDDPLLQRLLVGNPARALATDFA